MKYVGIDLGTTNSAISSFDGEKIQLFKSPEQHDVTPSAIFIDRRGNKYVGSRAYNNAARNPDNAAVLFKRLMGTSTPVKLPAVNLTMTPEECSAEVLRTLFGYLPEEIRGDGDTGTVITVPAAFNQMQKDSTMSAADAAGLGRVALMQEPVAAVMSVMRQRKNDGVFVVYDLGGGTLDIAIAESIAGRVNLLAHGGIAMCGGRDFNRILFDNVVKPWLLENFDLPEDLAANPQFKSLLRMATWAAEKAKIELSQKEDAVVSLPETELGVRDQAGEEIYIDIAIDRKRYDALIAPKVEESIQSARETLEKAGLSPHDVERVVFVGGPTHYKPLRDKVAFELGIAPSTDVNPMTAVAEGAAVFAESIDWASQSPWAQERPWRAQCRGRDRSLIQLHRAHAGTESQDRRQVRRPRARGHRVSDRQPGHGLVVRPRCAEGWCKCRTQPDQARRQHLQGVRVRLERRARRLARGQDRHRPHCRQHRRDSGIALHRRRGPRQGWWPLGAGLPRARRQPAPQEGQKDLQGGRVPQIRKRRFDQVQAVGR
ncbi:Hsp70 family protein [Pseudomonas aeruginosa]